MKVLVFGGSGQIGHFLLPRLRDSGAQVWALSRSEQVEMRGVTWLRGALPDAPAPAPDVDAVISLGPLRAFAEWLDSSALNGAPRVLAMSSMSVVTKRDSADPGEQDMIAALADAETRVIDISTQRGFPCTLLRCTLIYGAGMDTSLTPIARRAMRWRIFPLPQGRGLRQPVHADDLAQALQAALTRSESAGRTIALGGGERLSSAQMFARARAGLPVWTLPVPIPRGLFGMLARVLPSRAAMIARLDSDLSLDNTDAEHLLGVHPRAFEPRWRATSD